MAKFIKVFIGEDLGPTYSLFRAEPGDEKREKVFLMLEDEVLEIERVESEYYKIAEKLANLYEENK